MSRIAIFGGTFDPIHSAHLTVGLEAAEQLKLDQVLFVPAAHPPHKAESTEASYEDRYRMVALACEADSRFVASRLEDGEGRSYSVLTIEKLRARSRPGDRIFFLIGADAFAEIATWQRWQEVVTGVEFIVVTRPGHNYEVPAGATVHRLETLALPVSSSEIRLALSAGRAAEALPAAVSRYVQEHGLYR